MKITATIAVVLATFIAPQMLVAQDGPAASPVSQEHKFLQKFVGEWDVKSAGSGITGQSIMKSTMLGNRWVVNSSEAKISNINMQSLQMIGYDPAKKKYIGTWADSMTNHLWQYEGTVDKTGKKLTLNTKGPSMSGDGGTSNYRDSYEFTDDDTFVAQSAVEGPDGKWQVMMEGSGKRRTKTTATGETDKTKPAEKK